MKFPRQCSKCTRPATWLVQYGGSFTLAPFCEPDLLKFMGLARPGVRILLCKRSPREDETWEEQRTSLSGGVSITTLTLTEDLYGVGDEA